MAKGKAEDLEGSKNRYPGALLLRLPRTSCGHTFCGPCLQRDFEIKLRENLNHLRHSTHRNHRASACQAIPKTKEERRSLEQCLKQHEVEADWMFQYRCPNESCGIMVSARPAVDLKLQAMLTGLLGSLRGRFHPAVYTAAMEPPTILFSGLFVCND